LAVFVIFDATITKHWHIDMDAYLDRRFPSTADIERAALRLAGFRPQPISSVPRSVGCRNSSGIIYFAGWD
jgi:hypothetical protein